MNTPTPIAPASADKPSTANRMVVSGIDRVLTVQRPVVLAHIRSIRARNPAATPDDVLRILEKRYLAAVTTGGAAVGAAAVIPAVGVGASLALSGVETAGFLEASALYAQSVTEVHGIPVEDPDRARALVMALVLGSAGSDLVRQFAGQVSGGPGRNAFWGEMVTQSLPKVAVGRVADQIKKTFLKRFAATSGASAIGRAIPFGIGAVIGGTGNHILGRQIVKGAREAFPPPPARFPDILEVAPKPTRIVVPKEKRIRRVPKLKHPHAIAEQRPRPLGVWPPFDPPHPDAPPRPVEPTSPPTPPNS